MIHRLFLLMVVLMTATTITTVYADDRTRHHQPIREKLSIEQGYYTRLGEPTPFGYIHYMEGTFRRFLPDQPVHQQQQQQNDTGIEQEFPDYVLTVLSNVNYTAADAPIYFEGLVSRSTFMQLDHHSLRRAAIMLQFTTYAFDEASQSWFRRFYSGDRLRGRVGEALVDPVDAGERFKLVLRIDPLPGLMQRLWLARNAEETPRGVFWGPKPEDTNEKFQQIVMNDIVF